MTILDVDFLEASGNNNSVEGDTQHHLIERNPITLRDQFAMAALTVAVQGYDRMTAGEADRILGRTGVNQSEEKYRLDKLSLIAKLAYEAADAMMKERAK